MPAILFFLGRGVVVVWSWERRRLVAAGTKEEAEMAGSRQAPPWM
jgi:hypothetical protein